jgi:hypothetical protein
MKLRLFAVFSFSIAIATEASALPQCQISFFTCGPGALYRVTRANDAAPTRSKCVATGKEAVELVAELVDSKKCRVDNMSQVLPKCEILAGKPDQFGDACGPDAPYMIAIDGVSIGHPFVADELEVASFCFKDPKNAGQMIENLRAGQHCR